MNNALSATERMIAELSITDGDIDRHAADELLGYAFLLQDERVNLQIKVTQLQGERDELEGRKYLLQRRGYV